MAMVTGSSGVSLGQIIQPKFNKDWVRPVPVNAHEISMQRSARNNRVLVVTLPEVHFPYPVSLLSHDIFKLLDGIACIEEREDEGSHLVIQFTEDLFKEADSVEEPRLVLAIRGIALLVLKWVGFPKEQFHICCDTADLEVRSALAPLGLLSHSPYFSWYGAAR